MKTQLSRRRSSRSWLPVWPGPEVKRVGQKRAAGKMTDGTVGMVWINGENFLTMKREDLLLGPFAESLPNFACVDVLGKPTTRIDFPEPVEGLEAPWGMAELLALTFNLNEAANEIAAGRLAPGVVSYQFDGGSIGNTHLLAIPFNARAREGAQVLINFLLSSEAQARKADVAQWGDPTVLAMEKLSPAEPDRFNASLPERHGSWVEPLEREWPQRYGQ